MKKLLLVLALLSFSKISFGMKKDKYKELSISSDHEFSSDEEIIITNKEITEIFQIIDETKEEHIPFVTDRANKIVAKELKYNNYVFGNALKEGKKNIKYATIVYLIKSELKRIEEKQQKDLDEIKLLLKNLQVNNKQEK